MNFSKKENPEAVQGELEGYPINFFCFFSFNTSTGGKRMLEGFSRFISGSLGLNGLIIGGIMILLGLLVIIALKSMSKNAGEEKSEKKERQ